MAAVLDIDAVTVTRGRRSVLREASLSVKAGEIVALIGPNGSGKTTLLEVIVGARRADRGHVRIYGRPVTTIAERSAAMAWVADAAEPARERRVAEILDAPRNTWVAALGLAHLLDARAGRLSRGERRRVALAEGLGRGRPIAVLDEPFAALDPLQLRAAVAELRRAAAGGTAFVLSMHEIESALRVADRAVLLRDGAVVASGSEAELRATAGCPDGSLEDLVVALLTGGAHAT